MPMTTICWTATRLNPVGGDLVNGDNTPQVTTARILIVDAPAPHLRHPAGKCRRPGADSFLSE